MKEYIGDGLYADMEGSLLIVTSEDGIRVLDTIYFEWSVLEALNDYYQRQSTASEAKEA